LEHAVTARERLLDLFVQRSFRLGEFTLASGRKSDFYIDCRTTTMHAEGQVLLGEVGCEYLAEAGWQPDLIGGLTMGADPIAYAVAGESFRRGKPIHAFSVRKQAKRHGTGRQIEGCFEPKASIVVVEDVITTGGSALQACEAIKAAQGSIVGVLAAVDREEGGSEAIAESGFEVISMFGIGELRKRAAELAG
jgi:orotate phosphoribosyltransferase